MTYVFSGMLNLAHSNLIVFQILKTHQILTDETHTQFLLYWPYLLELFRLGWVSQKRIFMRTGFLQLEIRPVAQSTAKHWKELVAITLTTEYQPLNVVISWLTDY